MKLLKSIQSLTSISLCIIFTSSVLAGSIKTAYAGYTGIFNHPVNNRNNTPLVISASSVPYPSVPYSFDMVREPEILPIIPEKPIQVEIKQVVVENEVITVTGYQLASDVLFEFDKHTLTVGNEHFVYEIADVIKNAYDRLDRVTVTGHTDRLGSDRYNDGLSMRRANTVKGILASSGIDITKIEAFGVGERQPVKECPNMRNRNALKECLKPNRRVEINVYGLSKPDKIKEVIDSNDVVTK